MNWQIAMALIVVCATVWALIKRYETRLVLLTAGLVMALLSMKPMMAFQQFDKSMTNGALIIAICSAMGFAAVVSLTKCDLHLVALLTKPLRRMGILLLPACSIVTGIVAIAHPVDGGLLRRHCSDAHSAPCARGLQACRSSGLHRGRGHARFSQSRRLAQRLHCQTCRSRRDDVSGRVVPLHAGFRRANHHRADADVLVLQGLQAGRRDGGLSAERDRGRKEAADLA